MKSSGRAWCFSVFCCRDDTKVDGVQPEDNNHRMRSPHTDSSHQEMNVASADLTSVDNLKHNMNMITTDPDPDQTDGLWAGVLTDLLWCRRCWNNRLKSLQWTLRGTSGIVPSHPSLSARGAGRASSAARLQQTHGTNVLYTQNILYLM